MYYFLVFEKWISVVSLYVRHSALKSPVRERERENMYKLLRRYVIFFTEDIYIFTWVYAHGKGRGGTVGLAWPKFAKIIPTWSCFWLAEFWKMAHWYVIWLRNWFQVQTPLHGKNLINCCYSRNISPIICLYLCLMITVPSYRYSEWYNEI